MVETKEAVRLASFGGEVLQGWVELVVTMMRHGGGCGCVQCERRRRRRSAVRERENRGGGEAQGKRE